MAKYVGTKTYKQCKSKFQKKELDIYDMLEISEQFEEITNKKKKIKKNFVEKNNFSMFNDALIETTLTLTSPVSKFIDLEQEN